MVAVAEGVLFVHSCPRAVSPHIEWATGRILGVAVNFHWQDQPAEPGTRRAEFTWSGTPGDGARLASAIRGWEDVRFEVTEECDGDDGSRWMRTPALGMFRAQTDRSGGIVVGEDRLRQAMADGRQDAFALHEALARALGQPWDDELEPFRRATAEMPVVWLRRSS